MRISEQEMQSRKRMAQAQTAISEAMEKCTEQHGELTAVEWALVMTGYASRMLRYELKEEETGQ